MKLSNTLLAAALALTFGLVGAPITTVTVPEARAESDDPSSTRGQCRKGKVWDRRRGRCVEARQDSQLDPESIYEAGRTLANAGRYQEAVEVLWLADGTSDARILNMLGFSNRMMGRLEIGLSYYRQAIAADPTYTLVREYYGEGLLQAGDVAGAQDQLREIRALCGGRECPEYAKLETAIAEYRRNL